MKSFKRKICAIAVVAVVFFTSVPVFAATQEQMDETIMAADHISQTMWFIMEQYAGGDVSVNSLFEGAMRGMMDTLDAYSAYYTSAEFKSLVDSFSGETVGIGIQSRFVDGVGAVVSKVFPDSPAMKAGVLAGDVIRKVNGASTEGLPLSGVLDLILEKNPVSIDFERDGAIISHTITKGKIERVSVFSEKLSEYLQMKPVSEVDKIGYICITDINANSAKEFKEEIGTLVGKGVKRLIIDLRGNPGGTLDTTVEMCRLVVPEGGILTTVDKAGQRKLYKSDLKKRPFEKIVILTDGGTASAAEVFASAMQDSKAAVIVGEKTYGKGVVQGVFETDKGGLTLTIMEYFTRDGKKLNNIGITPDVPVEMPPYVNEMFSLDETKSADGVLNVKKSLVYLKYAIGEMDKTYDKKTELAVVQFQKDHSISPDGRLTYETIIAINNSVDEIYYRNDPVLLKGYETVVSQ